MFYRHYGHPTFLFALSRSASRRIRKSYGLNTREYTCVAMSRNVCGSALRRRDRDRRRFLGMGGITHSIDFTGGDGTDHSVCDTAFRSGHSEPVEQPEPRYRDSRWGVEAQNACIKPLSSVPTPELKPTRVIMYQRPDQQRQGPPPPPLSPGHSLNSVA